MGQMEVVVLDVIDIIGGQALHRRGIGKSGLDITKGNIGYDANRGQVSGVNVPTKTGVKILVSSDIHERVGIDRPN